MRSADMPFATVLLISFGLHALIGWSLAADLSPFAAQAPGALWALLVARLETKMNSNAVQQSTGLVLIKISE